MKASKELCGNKLTVLTMHQDNTEEREWLGIKRKIRYCPLTKWLLL
ncbi:MAG: hypothetical protein LBI79_02510 [Nitrososphaerota archaeon]|nr:hypothetical protein [Nitrososphaerota archaeon]